MPLSLMPPHFLKFSCIATLDAFHEGLRSSKFMCLLKLTSKKSPRGTCRNGMHLTVQRVRPSEAAGTVKCAAQFSLYHRWPPVVANETFLSTRTTRSFTCCRPLRLHP